MTSVVHSAFHSVCERDGQSFDRIHRKRHGLSVLPLMKTSVAAVTEVVLTMEVGGSRYR